MRNHVEKQHDPGKLDRGRLINRLVGRPVGAVFTWATFQFCGNVLVRLSVTSSLINRKS